ncbi:uncharacterized protein LOC134944213 [Pseudophryne corroboree]|uniref:uncharacterized protein LOC134944213 n=1 Tax=Pseudophryne corroboree TaxID=495146 RepID=UPI003081F5A0
MRGYAGRISCLKIMSYENRDFLSGFISLYREEECLWLTSSPDYSNKQKREAAYTRMVEYSKPTFSAASVVWVRKKIANLRTVFVKENRKVEESKRSGAGAEKVYVPQLWYYKDLNFPLEKRSAKESLVVMAEFEEGSLYVEEAEGTPEEDLSCTPALINTSPEEPTSPPQTTGKRKPRKTKFVEDPLLAEARSQLLRKPDEFDNFASYVSKTMRKVSSQQQVECQRLVSQVLYQTLSGQLTPEWNVHGPEPQAPAPHLPLTFSSPPPTYPTYTTTAGPIQLPFLHFPCSSNPSSSNQPPSPFSSTPTPIHPPYPHFPISSSNQLSFPRQPHIHRLLRNFDLLDVNIVLSSGTPNCTMAYPRRARFAALATRFITNSMPTWIEKMSYENRDFLSGFISLYHEEECLWLTSSPDYSNKQKREAAYTRMVEYSKPTFSAASVVWVRKKIANLRTVFVKENRKVEESKRSGAGAEKVYVPQLWYYKDLNFPLEKRSAKESLVVMAEFEEGSLYVEEAEGTPEEDLSCTPALINTSPEEPTSPPQTTGKRKPRKTKFVEDPLLAEARSQLLRKPDEFDNFASYVSKTMRKVSSQQQVECQRLVSQVLYQTLSGQLTPEWNVHGPEPQAPAPHLPLTFSSPPPTYPTSTTTAGPIQLPFLHFPSSSNPSSSNQPPSPFSSTPTPIHPPYPHFPISSSNQLSFPRQPHIHRLLRNFDLLDVTGGTRGGGDKSLSNVG